MVRNAKPAGSSAPLLVAAALFLLGGVTMVATGVHRLGVRQSGQRLKATVSACSETTDAKNHRTVICTGSWVIGGELVAGNGHVVTGEIVGAGLRDQGKTVGVIADGEEAYLPDGLLKGAIGAIAVGLLLGAMGVVALLARPKRARAASAG